MTKSAPLFQSAYAPEGRRMSGIVKLARMEEERSSSSLVEGQLVFGGGM
jgi:hypothetical protein